MESGRNAEGKELEGIEKVKARERQKGGRGGVLLTENFPEAKGESRDRTDLNPNIVENFPESQSRSR